MAAFLSGAWPLPQIPLVPPSWTMDGHSLVSEQEGLRGFFPCLRCLTPELTLVD